MPQALVYIYLQYNWSRHWTVFSSSTSFWKIRLLRKYLTCGTPIILFMKKWKYMVTLFVCSAGKRFDNQCGEQINTILNEKVSYTYRIQNSWKHVMVCFVQNSVIFFKTEKKITGLWVCARICAQTKKVIWENC